MGHYFKHQNIWSSCVLFIEVVCVEKLPVVTGMTSLLFVTLNSDRFWILAYDLMMSNDLVCICVVNLHYVSCRIRSEVNGWFAPRFPSPRLPSTTLPPARQQNQARAQNSYCPQEDTGVYECEKILHSAALPFLVGLFSLLQSYLTPSPHPLPGCEVKEHGFLGQPGSEVPVHAGLLRALFQRQLRTVQTGRQGERGERETAESTG